jgi:hypothetical protein
MRVTSVIGGSEGLEGPAIRKRADEYTSRLDTKPHLLWPTAARLRESVSKAKTAAAALAALPKAELRAGLDALAVALRSLPLPVRARLAAKLLEPGAVANYSS